MPKVKPDAQVSVYECVSPILHDGERVEVGEMVEFPTEVAEPLIAAGALRAALATDQQSNPQA
jgi:hypothetical protein